MFLKKYERNRSMPGDNITSKPGGSHQGDNITDNSGGSHQEAKPTFDLLRINAAKPRELATQQLQSDARTRGHDRVKQANQLGPQEIESYKISSEQNYRNRYETEISPLSSIQQSMGPFYRPNFGKTNNPINTEYNVYTYVKGNTEYACYENKLKYDSEKNIWTFYGITNFKRRPPGKDGEEIFFQAVGKFDSEVKWEGTQPLPHEDIIWNQVREASKRHNSNISLDIYHGQDIRADKDKKIVDALMPNIREKKTFSRGDDGYFIILGTDTGKAKPKLGALFGKSISSITIEKKLDKGRIAYSIEYKYDNI